MADIPLRTYVEQLDNLIERKQPEEVIAHCRHILGMYPKHVDTYRMLGKALLEKKRHGDAADIFQRVLSVMPDDFIAHVGMSIVREDEANLDAATWHMERAFESSPANGAIQQELCRLYGRRDGVVPARARLTRGALARMYVQGGLYMQAEAELKAALTADADRIDLMTKLADVYWQTDQAAQAAQASAAILQKLPYSLEANRILVNVFRAQGRPNDASVYRQRLEALDPYEAFADPAANGAGAARVEAAKVAVARLEYVPGMEDSGSPDWLTSIGAKFEEPAGAHAPETQPDWLSGAGDAAKALPAEGYQPGQGSVPDWLKDLDSAPGATGEVPTPSSLDWLKDTGATVVPLHSAPSQPHDSQPEEDLPDWLAPRTGPLPADAVPDWMLKDASEAEAADEPPGTAPLAMADAVAPLPEAPAAPPQPPAAEPAHPALAAAQPAGELPDWLKATVGQESEEDLPDWLKAITAQPLPAAEAPLSSRPSLPRAPVPAPREGAAPDDAVLPPSTALADLPDWLQSAAGADAGTGPLPDWLDHTTNELSTAGAPTLVPAEPAMSAATPVTGPAAEAPAQPEAPAVSEPAMEHAGAPLAPTSLDDLPDWLKAGVRADEPFLAAAPAEPVATPAQAPVQPPAVVAAAPAETPEPAFEIPDWLKAVAPAEANLNLGAKPLSMSTAATGSAPAPQDDAELPDWLQSATNVTARDETPVWLQTAPAGPTLVSTPAGEESEPDIPDWLRNIGAGAPPSGTPPVELPDFLQLASPEAIARAEQPLEMEPKEQEPAEEEPPAALPADIPDWLKALAPSQSTVAPASSSPARAEAPTGTGAEDSLSWMDELTAGASPGGEPAPEEPPAWLAASAAAEPEPATAAPLGAGEDKLSAEIPPWAQNEEPGPTDTIVGWLAGKHVPDWLRKSAPEAPSLPAVAWESASANTPVEPAGVDSLPAATEQTSPAPQPEPAAQAEPAEAAASQPEAMDSDAAFAWLESLAMHQGARPEELLTSPAEVGPVAPAADSVAPTPALEAAPEPSQPVAELPVLAAETPEPAPAEAPAATSGSLEAFLRQAEAALPVEHLVDTAPAKRKLPVAEAPAAAGEPTAAVAPEPEAAGATAPTMAAPTEPQSADFDADAAMRWLEGLAAQQGAKPEELLTAPEERTLEAPAWVAEQAAAIQASEPAPAVEQTAQPEPAVAPTPAPELALAADTPAAAATQEAPAAEIPAAPVVAAVEPPAEAAAVALPEVVQPTLSPEADADAAMRWLEGLAAQQGAKPEELLTTPEERTLQAPTWVTEQAAAAEPQPQVMASVEPPAPAMPEIEPEPAQVEPEPAAALETPEWLKALSVAPAMPAAQPEPAQAEPEPAAALETPEWLKALGVTPAEPATPAAPQAEPEPAQPAPEPAAALQTPEWLKTLAAEDEQAQAEQPAMQAAAAPVETTAPAGPAEAAEPATASTAADLDKLSRLAERLAATRRARETEMEARFAEQRATQEAARRWVEERLTGHGTGPLATQTAAAPQVPPSAAPEPAAEPVVPVAAQAPAAPVEAQAPAAEPAPPGPKPPSPTPSAAVRRHPRPSIRVRRSRRVIQPISPAAAPAAPTVPAEALARGQEALSSRDYETAVAHLSGLVEHGHHLDTVVQSLETATSAERAPVPVLRLLGDAYLRTDQLQKALDTYRQALSRL